MDKCMDREMNGWTDQCMPRFPLYPNRDHLQKPLSLNALHNLPSAWLSLPLKKFKIAPNSLTHFSIGLSIRKSLKSFNFSKPIKKLCLSSEYKYMQVLRPTSCILHALEKILIKMYECLWVYKSVKQDLFNPNNKSYLHKKGSWGS